MPHHIITGPLRTRGTHPGPVTIKMTRTGIVFIMAGEKNIQVTGGAVGTWPTPVVIDDPATLDRLRHPREVRRIEITYADGVLDVRVAELAHYQRQPWLPFGDIPVRPTPVVVPVLLRPAQFTLGF